MPFFRIVIVLLLFFTVQAGQLTILGARTSGSATRVRWSGTAGRHVVLYVKEANYRGTPSLLNMASRRRSLVIKGLIPASLYELKLIRYSSGGRLELGETFHYNSTGLDIPVVRNVKTRDVLADRATLNWSHDITAGIQDVYFMVYCYGNRLYVTSDGHPRHDQFFLQRKVRPSAGGKESISLSGLQPNTNYSCHVRTAFSSQHTLSADSVMDSVKTQSARPVPPPPPRAATDSTKSSCRQHLNIYMQRTSTRNGLISKYTLLAVPMKLRLATAGEAGYEAIDRTAPTTAVTAHLAAKAMASVPFIIGDFSAKSVPRNVSIALCRETDLSRAFQPGSQYSFVTVAMGVVQDHTSTLLVSASQPSLPPFTATNETDEAGVHHMIVIFAVTMAIVAIAIFSGAVTIGLILFLIRYRKSKFKYNLVGGNESEDENILYTRRAANEDNTAFNPVYEAEEQEDKQEVERMLNAIKRDLHQRRVSLSESCLQTHAIVESREAPRDSYRLPYIAPVPAVQRPKAKPPPRMRSGGIPSPQPVAPPPASVSVEANQRTGKH